MNSYLLSVAEKDKRSKHACNRQTKTIDSYDENKRFEESSERATICTDPSLRSLPTSQGWLC